MGGGAYRKMFTPTPPSLSPFPLSHLAPRFPLPLPPPPLSHSVKYGSKSRCYRMSRSVTRSGRERYRGRHRGYAGLAWRRSGCLHFLFLLSSPPPPFFFSRAFLPFVSAPFTVASPPPCLEHRLSYFSFLLLGISFPSLSPPFVYRIFYRVTIGVREEEHMKRKV